MDTHRENRPDGSPAPGVGCLCSCFAGRSGRRAGSLPAGARLQGSRAWGVKPKALSTMVGGWCKARGSWTYLGASWAAERTDGLPVGTPRPSPRLTSECALQGAADSRERPG